MKIVTSEQMREIDRVTIEQRGVPGIELMRRAGRAVAREAREHFMADSAAIVTGKGNNAGDGFVAARELQAAGVAVHVFALCDPSELRGDALTAWREMGHAVERTLNPSLETLRTELPRYDLVIDAIFGTGLSGPVRDPWPAVFEVINGSGAPVLAVDIPSGVPGTVAGEIGPGPCIQATATLTIGRPKAGMVIAPGLRATGSVVVEEISFPADLLEDDAITLNMMTLPVARELLPDRNPAGHKGTFGRLLIAAGSEGMTGAAVLAARSAARSGAGLVYCAYPERLGSIMESHLVEPVKLPLAGRESWFVGEQAQVVIGEARGMQAMVLGPGIGQNADTAEFIEMVLTEVNVPMVLDADALNLLADGRLELLRGRKAPMVLTPHPGEAARLLGCKIGEVQSRRLHAFEDFARDYQCVVVLKGAQTVITAPDGQRWVNPTGNSGLSKGGSGDVLTGLIGGLLAQGCAAVDAARLGVFLHGLAADLAAKTIDPRAMIASDVIDHFSAAFRHLQGA